MRRISQPSVALLSLCLAAQFAIAQDTDVTPPELVDFSFSPTSIDVSAGPVSVTATLHLTDDLAGASSASVFFRSPSGQSQGLGAGLIAGTRLDGTFEGSVDFPQFAENGTWTVTSVNVFDLVGNRAFFDTATLASRGFATELHVVSVPSDTEGPSVTGIFIDPPTVDVSLAAQTVVVELDLEDALSGVEDLARVGFALEIRSPTSGQSQFIGGRDFVRNDGGTAQMGTWRGTVDIPLYSEPGIWQIARITLVDVAANFAFFNTANLQALGLPTELEVISATPDTAAPQLVSFDFSPLLINTSTGSELVNVSLGLTDDLAGVDFSRDTPFTSFFYGVIFRSPSGQQTRFSSFPVLTQGDVFNGVWERTAFFPQFSEQGTWRVTNVIFKDAVRNVVRLDTDDLNTMGFPTQLVVIQPSLMGDGTIADPGAGGTVMDDVFADRAQVTFPPGVLSQATSVAIDVFQEPLDVPIPMGFQAAGSLFVNIDLTPQPAFPLPPPGLTVVLPLEDPLPAGTNLNLFRVDPMTGTLVAAIDVVTGLPVIGQVDPGGLSATFTGIESLSVVVGLLPDTVPFASFDADLEIDEDELEIEGSFTLGSGSNGIDVFNEDLTLQVGDFRITIPAASFEMDDGELEFEGDIDGAKLDFELEALGNDSFGFEAEAEDALPDGTAGLLDVTLTIGDDTGTITVTADDDEDSDGD